MSDTDHYQELHGFMNRLMDTTLETTKRAKDHLDALAAERDEARAERDEAWAEVELLEKKEERDANIGHFTPEADRDIERAASIFGVHKEAIKAIIAMESAGRWEGNERSITVSGKCLFPYTGMWCNEAADLMLRDGSKMPTISLDDDRMAQVNLLAKKIANLSAPTRRMEIHHAIDRYFDQSFVARTDDPRADAKALADRLLQGEA